MFDTIKTGKKIKSRRNELNMTQMELADKMGVSFQAVSNWERGESMPDIGKLSLLSEVLGIEIKELLGEGKESETIEKVMKEKEVEKEDFINVAPVIPPKTLERMVNEKKDSINLSDIIALAPYLDSDELFSILESLEIEDIRGLLPIAPYLESSDLGELIREKGGNSLSSLSVFAPFLESDDIGEIVEGAIENGTLDFHDASGLFAHMDSEDIIPAMRKLIEEKNLKVALTAAPFMDSDDLGEIIRPFAVFSGLNNS